MPAGRSYAVFVGSPGDPVSSGRTYTYTQADASFLYRPSGVDLLQLVLGDESWTVNVAAPYESATNGLPAPGYYPDAVDLDGGDLALDRLRVRGPGTECDDVTGWFTMEGTFASSYTIRFAQSCDGAPLLHGKIHYEASDATAPAGPGDPAPAGLWNVFPEVAGDYVYLQSPPGEPIGAGQDRLFRSDVIAPVDARYGVMSIVVEGPTPWRGTFQSPYDHNGAYASGWMPQIVTPAPGFYRFERAGNPASGDIAWTTAGRRCADPSGWVAIDRIEADGYTVTSLSMRFEERCGDAPPLRGKVVIGGVDPLPLPGGPPFGFLDRVAGTSGAVEASGWAIDPDTARPVQVHVYVDGRGLPVTADRARPDVANAFPGYGPAHGFEARVAASPGVHRVCAYGIDSGGGVNALLGCRTVTVPDGRPFGFVDDVVGGPGGVEVSGWAIDPDTAGVIAVHVYVDGRGTAVLAGGSRPDVGRAFPGYGSDHGYSAFVPAGPGVHQACAYGIDSAGGPNTLLGCRSVVVPGGAPVGFLDEAVGVTGGVRVSGWSIDPDTAAPVQVHVYVDGAGVPLVAEVDRPDVGRAFPRYGSRHGYAATLTSSAGTHRVCAYGIDSAGGTNSLLGCRTVVVP